ncbi:MAG: cyclase family protein [Ruminococcaceae bacterium]|jgi:kynurenine formamidase|nr:cyclase family protein [Oscillospiraceae bacterium]
MYIKNESGHDRWIDLSLPIQAGMPVYPGDPPVSVRRFLTHGCNGVQASAISLSCHAGTHVDVPRHYLPKGAALESILLDQLTGPSLVVRACLTAEGLIDLASMDLSEQRAGDNLLLATGWDRLAGKPAYYQDIPRFAPGSTRFLLEKGIPILGLDLPTVEEAADPPDHDMMHQVLLEEGILIVECLCGLEKIIGRRVQFYAFPLLLPGCDGSPVRACARMLPV